MHGESENPTRCGRPGIGPVVVTLVAAAAVVAACSSTSGGHRLPAVTNIGWAPGAAEQFNGTPPTFTAESACGSGTDTFLREIAHRAPTDLRVMYEWGDVVPAGRQVLISGTVATTHLGPGDLPMDHPFGDDLSMDVAVDPPFQTFARQLGTGQSDVRPGWAHVELSSGLIPHLPRPSAAHAGETWRQLSDFNLSGIQPGFDLPAVGDRVLVGGRYIVDCGHDDFHTELHPMTFLAWAHADGARTVVHVYANGYRDSEQYQSMPANAGHVSDTARLGDPTTAPLPKSFVNEVIGMVTGSADRLRSFELMEAIRPALADWEICAPADASGKKTVVHYDLRTRPGVTASVKTDNSSGCALVRSAVTADLRSPDVAMRSCTTGWDYLDTLAGTDVRATVKALVPAQAWPAIQRDPIIGCVDALSAPAVQATPAGTTVATDSRQPFPLYGVLTVERR